MKTNNKMPPHTHHNDKFKKTDNTNHGRGHETTGSLLLLMKMQNGTVFTSENRLAVSYKAKCASDTLASISTFRYLSKRIKLLFFIFKRSQKLKKKIGTRSKCLPTV